MKSRLSDYEFVDLFIGKDFAEFKGLKGSSNTTDPVPATLYPQIHELRVQCHALVRMENDPEFSLIHEDIIYRGATIRDFMGNSIYVLRRASPVLRSIESLGFAPRIVRELMMERLEGLIVIAGSTATGKTTTATSILKGRLDRHGGVAMTIEDPPEININGKQGKGRCIQVRASRRTGGYKEHLVRALRSNPDMILLGEVREEDAAYEAVNASLNGHFIITTIHATSIIQAIERLAQLGGSASNSGSDAMFKSLGLGLKMIIHQRLDKDPRTGELKMAYEALSLIGDDRSGARIKIQQGKVGHLIHDIDQQQILLRQNTFG